MKKELRRTLGGFRIEVSPLRLGCWTIDGPFLFEEKSEWLHPFRLLCNQ